MSSENFRSSVSEQEVPGNRAQSLWYVCDRVTGWLIRFAVIFSPWAFGTTQEWSIWTMNVTCYALGLLTWGKWAARRKLRDRKRDADWSQRMMIGLSAALLLYVLIAAINARATYVPGEWLFDFRSFIPWLPHSYSASHTWKVFYNYVAFACFFWATRQWLLDGRPSQGNVPKRTRGLIWLLTVNGAFLALEAIIQRTMGTNKLLFLQETRINNFADAQLGPFAYRSNGAQYLNLIWPVTIGLWATIRYRMERNPRHLLLPCAMIMIAAPILSLSRGGALVSIGLLLCSALALLLNRRVHWVGKVGLTLLMLFVAYVGLMIGGDKLKDRMGSLESGFLGREKINEVGRKIVADYPVFGTGPGTMNPVYNLYRESVDEYWPAQLHNDWLETLATFGWIGTSLIVLIMLVCVLTPFSRQKSSCSPFFFVFLWLALAGCLIHARFDFPLQIYSIVILFLIICAILASCSLRNVASKANE